MTSEEVKGSRPVREREFGALVKRVEALEAGLRPVVPGSGYYIKSVSTEDTIKPAAEPPVCLVDVEAAAMELHAHDAGLQQGIPMSKAAAREIIRKHQRPIDREALATDFGRDYFPRAPRSEMLMIADFAIERIARQMGTNKAETGGTDASRLHGLGVDPYLKSGESKPEARPVSAPTTREQRIEALTKVLGQYASHGDYDVEWFTGMAEAVHDAAERMFARPAVTAEMLWDESKRLGINRSALTLQEAEARGSHAGVKHQYHALADAINARTGAEDLRPAVTDAMRACVRGWGQHGPHEMALWAAVRNEVDQLDTTHVLVEKGEWEKHVKQGAYIKTTEKLRAAIEERDALRAENERQRIEIRDWYRRVCNADWDGHFFDGVTLLAHALVPRSEVEALKAKQPSVLKLPPRVPPLHDSRTWDAALTEVRRLNLRLTPDVQP